MDENQRKGPGVSSSRGSGEERGDEDIVGAEQMFGSPDEDIQRLTRALRACQNELRHRNEQ